MAAETDYQGGLTLAAGLPFLGPVSAGFSASLAATLPDIQARIAGALSGQVQIALNPPSLAASAALAAQIGAAIQAAFATPGVMVDITAAAALIAELSAILGQLQANLALSASLGSLLAAGGVHFYTTEGAVADMTGSLQPFLAGGIPGGEGPDQNGFALTMVAAEPGAITALRTLSGS